MVLGVNTTTTSEILLYLMNSTLGRSRTLKLIKQVTYCAYFHFTWIPYLIYMVLSNYPNSISRLRIATYITE